MKKFLALILVAFSIPLAAGIPEPGNDHHRDCCWCQDKDGENEVRVYSGSKSCEAMSGIGAYGNCRRIIVDGAFCSFTTMRRKAGSFTCSTGPLFYWDTAGKRSLAPPTLNPCQAREIVSATFGRSMELRAEGTGALPQTNEVAQAARNGDCTCGEDNGKCVAQKRSGGAWQQEFRVKPVGGDCDAACRQMFQESSTFSNCDRFLH